MSALEIKSYVMPNDETKHCVNARELWKSLNNKRKFVDWIKDRLNYTQAEENVDYILFTNKNIFDLTSPLNQMKHCNNKDSFDFTSSGNQNKSNRGGDRKSVNYIITLDLAKEMAMLERNDTGKSIRTYLIECEEDAVKNFNKQIYELKKEISISKELIACQERRIQLVEKQLRAATILEERRKLDLEIKELKRQGYLAEGDK